MAKKRNIALEKDILEVESNGNIIHTIVSSSKRVEQEPPFAKWYFDDFCKLNELTKQETLLLFALAGKMTYSNADNEDGNIIEISPIGRSRIMEQIGVCASALSRLFMGLEKKKVIARVGTGMYMISPYVLARGQWSEIKHIRVVWDYRIKKNGEIERTETLQVSGVNEQLEQLKESGVISDD